MPGALLPSQMRQSAPTRGSEGPEPGTLDTLGASFRTTSDDVGAVQRERIRNAYKPITRALEERNGKGRLSYVATETYIPIVSIFSDYYDADAIWRDIDAARKQDPAAFPDLPKTREEFERGVLTREGQRARDQRLLQRSDETLAAFAGGIGAQFRDPVNLATMPFGGGAKTVGQAVLREAVINGAIEGVQQIPLARSRERMGETLTAEEAAMNIAGGVVFGGLLGGGSKIVGDNWGSIKAAPKAVQEKAWATILDKVPALRERVGGTVDWHALDPHLPDIAEAVADPELLTDAERGAIAALRREAAVDAGNRFVPDGAGVESHYRLLGETMQGILDDAPTYVPKTRPSTAARLRSGTSVGSGVTGGAMQQVKSRIGVVESGNSATARNPRSSAMGVYQFTDGTWLAYFKRRFGADGLSDAQIIAKKSDRRLQDVLMDDLLADNSRALQDGGQSVTAGNLYLAHFAGPRGAIDLLQADPATPVARVLGERVVAANPFLRGWSAREVIEWAHRKMGDATPGVAPRADDPSAEDVFARLDDELADTQAEIARLDGELATGPRGMGDALDMEADAVPVADVTPLPRLPDDPAPDLRAGTTIAGMTAEARAAIPDLRRIVDERRDVSLNRTGPLAELLGVDERNLQLALQQLAIDGLVVQGRNGSFARFPRRKDGPEDLLTFVARNGGLTPKGFSQSLMERLPYMDNPPKGHDLQTIFEVERLVEWKRRPRNGDAGVRLAQPYRTTRAALIPGYGPLVRSTGKGLDEMGELLWEAGYFGPADVTPRPSENDVLNLLQDAWGSGRKVHSTYDEAAAEAAVRAADVPSASNPFRSEFQSDEHFQYEFRNFDRVAQDEFGIALDEEAFADAYRAYSEAGDFDIAGAVLKTIQREIEDVQAREIAERGMANAADIIEEWEEAFRADGLVGAQEVPPGRFDPRDPGADGATGKHAGRGEDPGPLDPETWARWDDPEGPAAKVDTESMEHDLRAALDRADQVDPGIAARQAQEARLRADAPMRSTSEQDGSMGTPLFDAADQPTFRLDEEGDEASAADILAEFDEDSAFLKTIKDCL